MVAAVQRRHQRCAPPSHASGASQPKTPQKITTNLPRAAPAPLPARVPHIAGAVSVPGPGRHPAGLSGRAHGAAAPESRWAPLQRGGSPQCRRCRRRRQRRCSTTPGLRAYFACHCVKFLWLPLRAAQKRPAVTPRGSYCLSGASIRLAFSANWRARSIREARHRASLCCPGCRRPRRQSTRPSSLLWLRRCA